ncbi:hypothetical protein ZHAS_00015935 [Anopheles sinensis]|uniref:HTH OST-type domain-containing protein n=1 Tax=Anopheles sinensis TaxID=74873 RepID=A0A084WCD5_ANOSI|nr:hypothetical protein ZHAS_00015935 [Anopheles sinensis]
MYGFRRLDELLLTMPDAVQLHGRGDNALVLPVDSGKSQHIRSMIAREKSKVRKPPNSSARNRSNGYQPTYKYSYTSPRTTHLPTNDESSEKIFRDQLVTSPIDLKECSADEFSDGQIVESVTPDPEEEPSAPTSRATPMTLADKFSEPEVPSTLIPESIQKAIVVKVHSPNDILVQLTCHLEMLVHVADALEIMYGELDSDSEWQLDVGSAKVGLCCIAKYETFWYRVSIAESRYAM